MAGGLLKFSPKTDEEMSFWEHLEVLRFSIIRTVLVLLAAVVVAFINKEFIYDVVILGPKDPEFFTNAIFTKIGLPLNQTPLKLVNIEIAGQFRSHLIISFITGLIAAFPYLLFELYLFIRPAMHDNEKSYFKLPFIAVTSILFFIGVLFGYYLVSPLVINFFSTYSLSNEIENTIRLSSYISNITTLCLACGLVFELPAIIYFLSKVGLATPEGLKRFRKHSIAVSFVLSAIITPPDVVSQILLAFPLIFLYEVSIYISRMVVGKQKSKELAIN